MAKKLTEAQFDELKRIRDESAEKAIGDFCDEHGWDRSKMIAHLDPAGPCYCACPTGPCQHTWDGPDIQIEDGLGYSVTCSRCGTSALSHDMRCGP